MATKKKTAEELTIEQADITTETVEEVNVEETTQTTYTVKADDTWISISETFRGNKSNYKYAQELIAKNGDKLTKGAIITL